MNTREPGPKAQFDELLSRFPPEIVARVKRSLPKLRRAFPGSYELVYDYGSSLVVSFSMSERGYEGIATIKVSPRAIQLYFDKDLPDPAGLLEGSGSKVRSVTLEAPLDVDHKDVQELIKAAQKHAGVTSPRTGTTRMVIKSKKKKPKRTARA